MKKLFILSTSLLLSTAAHAETITYTCGELFSPTSTPIAIAKASHMGNESDIQVKIVDHGAKVDVVEAATNNLLITDGTEHSPSNFFGFKNKTDQVERHGLDQGKYLYRGQTIRKVYRNDSDKEGFWVAVPNVLLQGASIESLKPIVTSENQQSIAIFEGDTSEGIAHFTCYKKQ